MSIPEYCTQNNGACDTCALVNYGRDCMNNKFYTMDNSENSTYLELVGIIKNWPKSRLVELRVFTLLWGIQNAELSPEIKADWQRDLDAFVDYKRRTLGKSARRKFEAMLENNKYMTYREG